MKAFAETFLSVLLLIVMNHAGYGQAGYADPDAELLQI